MGLLLINVVMYILQSMNIFNDHDFSLQLNALVDPTQWYRLITHMFLHSSLSHLMGNMIMLYAAGSMVEEKMNRAVYMFMYFFSGLCGGILSVWSRMQTGEDYYSLGASGAIYGIMGALIAWMLMNRQWKSIRFYNRILIAILLLFYGSGLNEEIDYMAHLGGFIAGLLFTGVYVIVTWNKKKDPRGGKET